VTVVFYISALVAVLATVMVVTRSNAVHALLYLIVSLLSVAMVFYALGAPFVAALEIIIYAGAIMVLFVFVVMMLNVTASQARERLWLAPRGWIGPAVLAAVLAGELFYTLVGGEFSTPPTAMIAPQQVGATLFGPYVLGVELASLLLLAALVGAFHLGRQEPTATQGRSHHDNGAC
jgi:NADH-quinone oxidoreductase subunit J